MTNTINANWTELKGMIRQTWGKLTDNDLMRAEGNWDEISAKIQNAYSYTKEKAWEEIEDFKKKHILTNAAPAEPSIETDKLNN
jgi:uncharacterized protein YjbJ (UPF0337 family)